MRQKAFQIGLAVILEGYVLLLGLTPLEGQAQAQGGNTIYVAPRADCGGASPCYAHSQGGPVDAASVAGVIPTFSYSISPVQKGYLCTSVYAVTSPGSSDANMVHEFYDEDDSLVYGFFETVEAGASRVYDLSDIGGIPDDYIGYVVVSADQPFIYTLQCVAVLLSATVDIDPDTLSLKSKSKWVSAYIELPEGYDVVDINVGTVMLEGAIPAEAHPTGVGDEDDDGIPDLMVKFDRQAIVNYLDGTIGDVTLTVSGKLEDGAAFEGSDTITVKNPGKTKPGKK